MTAQSIVTFVGPATVNPSVATTVFAALGANPHQADQLGFFASPYFSQPLTLLAVPTGPSPIKLNSPRQYIYEEQTQLEKFDQQSESPDSDASIFAQLSEDTAVIFT